MLSVGAKMSYFCTNRLFSCDFLRTKLLFPQLLLSLLIEYDEKTYNMNIRLFLSGLALSLISNAMAQTSILSTSSTGYLSRGVQMYEGGNFNGAIDQLSPIESMTATFQEKETADYYIAKCYFNLGKTETALNLLNKYLTDYPTSFKNPDVCATIGDIYFYNGNFAQAILSYKKVNIKALTTSHKEDIIYRLAYSELRIKKGDTIAGRVLTDEDVTEYRNQAATLFETLSSTTRYSEAVKFYKAYMKYEKNDFDYALDDFLAIKKNSKLSYYAQYYISQIYFIKGDFNKVVEIGSALLDDNNDNKMDSEINRIVGESFYHNGDDRNAVQYINKYIESSEQEPMLTAQYILGVLNYRNADYQEAIEQLSAVTQEENVLGQSAYYYLGQAYRKQGNVSLAAMAFEKAAKQNYNKDTQEAAFYNYAVIQNEGGRTPFSQAIDMFEEFLNKFPNSKYADEVSEYMVSLYVSGNDYPKALASISRIKKPSNKVLEAKQVVLYNLGVNALSNGNTAEAQKYLSQAQSLAKYNQALNTQTNLWLGECAYRNGYYEQAAKYQNYFLKAINANDSNYGLGYYNLGYTRFQQRKYDDARNAFTKALSSNQLSNNLVNDANNRIGDTYYYAGNIKTAQKFYEKSSGDYAIYQKAMMLGLSKNYSGKIEQMKAMIKQYPSSSLVPMAMLEEADAYVSMNNNKKAIAVYNELIEKYPNNAYARKGMLNKAITERNAKNEASAIEAYKDVIKKYPTSEEASIALEDLKLIYADKGELPKLATFISSIPNAPKLDVSDMDRLTFEAAEKAYMGDNNDISKMKNYLESNPDGAYAANAKYYTAKYNYNKGLETDALELINDVEENNDDASFMEDALAIKASILVNQGKNKEALEAYKKLAEKATNSDNRITAQLGILRVSGQLNNNKDVIESANQLLKNGGLTAEEEKEVIFNRANAYYKQNEIEPAKKDFTTLSEDARNLYGAQAAYYLAEIQYNEGKLKEAESTLNNFIDAGTPHQYWLARGFILLADVYYNQGNTFEACEYLESLKSNYPGEEKDIFKMIEERLGKWKNESKKK